MTTTGAVELGPVSASIGDIEAMSVRPDKGYMIREVASVAPISDVNLDNQWQDFAKGLFDHGPFMKVTGSVDFVVNSFGALDHCMFCSGEGLIADNSHLLAFSDGCHCKVT